MQRKHLPLIFLPLLALGAGCTPLYTTDQVNAKGNDLADHKKEVIVEKLKEQLGSAKGSVLTTYTGLKIGRAHV